MIPYDQLTHHPVSQKLANILISRIKTKEPLFFHLMIAYYFSMAAACMRTNIKTPDGKSIPINMFCLNLAPSNFGKTFSAKILSKEVLDQFQSRFQEQTLPAIAYANLPVIANRRAARKGSDPDDELAKVEKEYASTGEYLFTFDSGTEAAVKQMRHKLLMANAGAMNLMIDEVGLHINKNSDMLDVFIELYDGEVGTKLVKNTREQQRFEQMRGTSPTNMMLFGTSNKLLDGGKQEDDFMTMLESGYARRCFFGYIKSNKNKIILTPQEALNMDKSVASSSVLQQLSNHFGNLADPININRSLVLPDASALTLYQYRNDCETKAKEFKEHEEVRRTELMARYYKVLKLAGAYAFVDGVAEISVSHIHAAIKLAEESGEAFESILKRDKPHVKLAKYIADMREDATHADLIEELPFYPKAQNQRHEMLSIATAWGYKHNIIIKKSFVDGIEFLRGETLKETNLDEMIVSYSNHEAYDYRNEVAPFDKLHILTQNDGLHWVNHHLEGGHRKEENAIPEFNMVVIDVDGGVALNTAKLLLKDYKAMYYTTKRHSQTDNRFRIILPTNFQLKLDAKDYKEFMKNFFDWLPFEVDDGTGQRARKWLSHNGHYEYNDGKLVDVLPFIPKTSKNEIRKQNLQDQQSLNNLERWVINNTGDGNRNNMILKYGMILVDAGFDFDDIRTKVCELNSKLPDKLDEAEILSTVMVTVSKALSQGAAA